MKKREKNDAGTNWPREVGDRNRIRGCTASCLPIPEPEALALIYPNPTTIRGKRPTNVFSREILSKHVRVLFVCKSKSYANFSFFHPWKMAEKHVHRK